MKRDATARELMGMRISTSTSETPRGCEMRIKNRIAQHQADFDDVLNGQSLAASQVLREINPHPRTTLLNFEERTYSRMVCF